MRYGTPPIPIDNSRVVPKPEEEVWSDAVEFFATGDVSIKTIDKASGLLVADRASIGLMDMTRFKGWADCGGVIPNTSMRGYGEVSLNVFMKPKGPTATAVTVTARFTSHAPSWLSTALDSYPCSSTGLLEDEVLMKLGAPPKNRGPFKVD